MKMLTKEATALDGIESAPGSAVALADDRRELTYGEMLASARRLATLLAERYGSERYLLVPASSDVEFVTTLLAVLYSGNTPIPVDREAPESALRYMQEKAGAPAVLGQPDPSEFEGLSETRAVSPSMPALVLFTSGTTGFPKGVILSHENLIHSCGAMSSYLGYRRYPSAAVVLPLHYSYALLSQVWCQLSIGGRVRLFAGFRNPIKFSRIVKDLELETFCGVPSTYNALSTIHRMSPISMPCVRVLCSAGAAMDRSKFGDIKEIFPHATFFNNYGMTEAAPRVAYIRDDDPRFFEPTCGRPMEGVRIKIVDPQSHRELPDGQPGMLVVAGPNISRGYLNDEEVTREAFTPEGYLISGDIAYREQEYLFICGRHDDIFNVGGEKVAPLEIERVLNQHPEVEASAVAGVPDEARGRVPVAFLKLRSAVSRRDLLAALEGQLAPAKIPQRYFQVKEFPMTSNGKIQRRRLSMEDALVVREIV